MNMYLSHAVPTTPKFETPRQKPLTTYKNNSHVYEELERTTNEGVQRRLEIHGRAHPGILE
jgi:hypothetical protein